MAALRKVNVSLFGGGVVGGGVATILKQRAAVFAQRGLLFDLKYLVVRDAKRPRDFEVPASAVVTESHDLALGDDSIDMVVEIMGGLDAAHRVVFESARRGKHVVTANKALLAAHLPEAIAAFPETRRPRLGFEAAVAGGIPIIRALQQSLAADSVECVAGVLNGTTNYMLTQGFAEAGSYAGALALAQRLGFAEADPTADVEGHDARNKLVLLARLAFRTTLRLGDVETRGISGVAAADLALAASLGYAVRLIGRAEAVAGRLHSSVGPALVPSAGVVSRAVGGHNAVQVRSQYLGAAHFTGPGAGRLATANSVVADMLGIALGEQARLPFPPVAGGADLPPAAAPGAAPCPHLFRLPAAACADEGRVARALAAEGLAQVGPVPVTPSERAVGGVTRAGSPGLSSAAAAALAGRLEVALGLPAGSVAPWPVFGDL